MRAEPWPRSFTTSAGRESGLCDRRPGGDVSFANNIKALADTAGAKVITDDFTYLDEPMFQNGVIGQAINTVVNQGAVYTNAAGNDGNNAYLNTSATATTDPFYTGNGAEFLNFGTASIPNDRQSVTLTPTRKLSLRSNGPIRTTTRPEIPPPWGYTCSVTGAAPSTPIPIPTRWVPASPTRHWNTRTTPTRRRTSTWRFSTMARPCRRMSNG